MGKQFNIFQVPFIVVNFDPIFYDNLERGCFPFVEQLINPSVLSVVEPMDSAVFLVQGYITKKRKKLIEQYLNLVDRLWVIAVGTECMKPNEDNTETIALDRIVEVDYFIPISSSKKEAIAAQLIMIINEIEKQVNSEDK